MRDDMFKVIVERPRWGASYAASPKLKRTPHADTKHIGLRRHAHIGACNTKMLNGNLAPLLRYLRRAARATLGHRLQRNLRQPRREAAR